MRTNTGHDSQHTRMIGWLDSGLLVDQVDPVAAIRGLKLPIFFIHGLDDVTVPPDCTRILFNGYDGPKKLRLEPGAGHCATADLKTEQYRRELRAFFLGQYGRRVASSGGCAGLIADVQAHEAGRVPRHRHKVPHGD